MTDPIDLEVVSVDPSGAPQAVPDTAVVAISDRGTVIAYEAIDATEATEPADGARRTTSRIWIRDRIGETSRPVAEFASVAPGISADGCVVAYSVLDAEATEASLKFVDRCAADSRLPLPIGTLLDTAALAEVDCGRAAGREMASTRREQTAATRQRAKTSTIRATTLEPLEDLWPHR